MQDAERKNVYRRYKILKNGRIIAVDSLMHLTSAMAGEDCLSRT